MEVNRTYVIVDMCADEILPYSAQGRDAVRVNAVGVTGIPTHADLTVAESIKDHLKLVGSYAEAASAVNVAHILKCEAETSVSVLLIERTVKVEIVLGIEFKIIFALDSLLKRMHYRPRDAEARCYVKRAIEHFKEVLVLFASVLLRRLTAAEGLCVHGVALSEGNSELCRLVADIIGKTFPVLVLAELKLASLHRAHTKIHHLKADLAQTAH